MLVGRSINLDAVVTRYTHHTELIDRTDNSGATVTMFACNICQKEFTANTYLKLHLVNHLSEPKRLDKMTFFCKICKLTVTSHDTLSHHIIVTKDDQNKPVSLMRSWSVQLFAWPSL